MTDAEELVATFSEVSHYFKASIQFYVGLQFFSQKNNIGTPEIKCKFCPKRSLPCAELIVKVQAKWMDKAIGAEDSVTCKAREEMLSIYHEITRLLFTGSQNDIKQFMAKIAQENKISCEGCKCTEWQNLKINKKGSHANDLQKM